MRPNYTSLLLLVLLCACFKAQSPASEGGGNGTDVILPLSTILTNNPDFHDFDTLIKRAGLYQKLTSGDSAYTLLIPPNEAFSASVFSMDSLLALSPDSLLNFIGYHILAGSYPTGVIPQTLNNPYTTLSGQTVYFSKPLYDLIDYDQQTIQAGSATLHVNGTATTKVDLFAQGGTVIQTLAAPLSPPYPSLQAFLSSRPDFTYLVAALKQFNLWNEIDSAGPYTLYIPENSAFLNNGITLSMIQSDTFNTQHYKPFLFTAGIIPGRIFMSDFTDALGTTNPTTYNAVGTVVFNNVTSNYNIPYIRAFDWIQGCCGFNQIGGNPGYTFINQPAGNGVVNGLNDLLVYPDSVYINQ